MTATLSEGTSSSNYQKYVSFKRKRLNGVEGYMSPVSFPASSKKRPRPDNSYIINGCFALESEKTHVFLLI